MISKFETATETNGATSTRKCTFSKRVRGAGDQLYMTTPEFKADSRRMISMVKKLKIRVHLAVILSPTL